MSKSIRILLADDHAVVHEGLQAVLAAQPDFDVVSSAFDGVQAVRLAAELVPDVILMDLVMPRMDGLEAIRQIRKENRQARILLLTNFVDDQRVFLAIKAGAMAYLLKDMQREQLYQAVRDLAQGRPVLHPTIAFKILQEVLHPPVLPLTQNPLTSSETETLRLVAQGVSYLDIAARMGVDVNVVTGSTRAILDKLHQAERTHSVLYVLRDRVRFKLHPDGANPNHR